MPLDKVNATLYCSLVKHENNHHRDSKAWWESGYVPMAFSNYPGDEDRDFCPSSIEEFGLDYFEYDQADFGLCGETKDVGFPKQANGCVLIGAGRWAKDEGSDIHTSTVSVVDWWTGPDQVSQYLAEYDWRNPGYYLELLHEYLAYREQFSNLGVASSKNKMDWASCGYVHTYLSTNGTVPW